MQTNKPNLIVDLTFTFSVSAIRFCDAHIKDLNKAIYYQLSRSATSIGSNVREAQNAESKKDFIHKLKISAKEADETEYWLKIVKEVYQIEATEELLSQILSIHKVLSKIISSSKKATTNN